MAKKDYGFSTDLLWETLWESTDDGLVIVDKDGIINEVNEASIKIHCINFKGMHISEYAKAIERFSVGKNTPAAVAELMISRALVGEKTQKKRWFLRSAARPEGYYSDTTGHTIRNEKGEITGAFVIIRDVTDFVRQEQKAQQNYKELLRESEVLWEAIPDLVFRISKDEVYLDFRIPQHEDLIASQKKLIGSRLEDHLNDDYGALTKWRKAIHQALESGKLQTTEYVLEFPEGLRYFEARIVPNGTEEVVSIVRNVSTQKESQKLIQESESRFRSIAEAISNPVLISRLSDGNILYANQRLYDALKLKNVDLVGKPTTDYYAHPKERLKVIAELRKQGHVYDWEMELVQPNGEHFWVLFSASTLNYSGEAALIATYVDITERRIAQAQLIQASKMATLGEMSAGVAHEINTPLATIRLSSHNVQQAWETKNYTELKKNLDLIDDEVNRTSTIIRQMLNFSRNAEQDKWEIMDLRRVMEQIFLMLKRQLEAAGIEIGIQLGRGKLPVYGNTTQLQQVFYNLASNAKDAVKGSSTRKIEFRIKRRKGKAIFEIEDNGEGIAPKFLPNIFEPFFSTKPLGKGTGLGLSISKKIILTHDGSIECKSKGSGQGALFRVFLPLKDNRV